MFRAVRLVVAVGVMAAAVLAPVSATWAGPSGEAGPSQEEALKALIDQEYSLALAESGETMPLVTGPVAAASTEGEAETPVSGDSAPKKGLPLPLHNIEGVGGAPLTPMAYLVNPGPAGTNVPLPSASYSFLKAGRKTLQVFGVTETLWKRIEIGYAFLGLGLGDFPDKVERATGVDIGDDDVHMHEFNIRGLLIEESAYCPAVTAGAQFKRNDDVQGINSRLGGGVRALGMDRSNGTDFTITMSKTFGDLAFGRPVIVTGGMRFAQGAQLGLLGFDDCYRFTGEGSVVCLVTDWFALGYEYRQKKNPYRRLGNLVGKEDAWQAIFFAFILSDRCTLAGGWGDLGNLANGTEDQAWALQFKYEF